MPALSGLGLGNWGDWQGHYYDTVLKGKGVSGIDDTSQGSAITQSLDQFLNKYKDAIDPNTGKFIPGKVNLYYDNENAADVYNNLIGYHSGDGSTGGYFAPEVNLDWIPDDRKAGWLQQHGVNPDTLMAAAALAAGGYGLYQSGMFGAAGAGEAAGTSVFTPEAAGAYQNFIAPEALTGVTAAPEISAGIGAVDAGAGGGLYSLANGTGTFGQGSALSTTNALTGTQVAGMGGGTGLTMSGAALPTIAEMGGGTGLLAGGMSALGPTIGATAAGAGLLSNEALAAAGLPSILGNAGSSIVDKLTSTVGDKLKDNLTGVGATTSGTGTGKPWWADMLGQGLGLAGGLMGGESAKQAAQIQADAQIQAAKIAADAAKFRPVGVTTNFGSSKFTMGPDGHLQSAGYSLAPWLQAQQDQLRGMSGGMLDQFGASRAATAPMGDAAAMAMKLGQGYLTSSPQEQAAKYMADQQALLAASRERDLSMLQSKLQAQGRAGLAMGATSGGMAAANPEMEAFFNAQRQQDLGLAAQATQGGMDYAKFGAGMVGTGGDLLKSMYGTQVASYDPYKTALSGMTTQESLGQNAMDIGIDLGKTATAARAQGGMLMGQGMNNAANTMAPANAYNPWASLLSGAGGMLSNYKWGT